VTRRRDPANRRLHLVELTPEGDALFFRLRDAAMAFDQQLRAGLSDTEATQLETLLTKLRANVRSLSRGIWYSLRYQSLVIMGAKPARRLRAAGRGQTGAFVALTAIIAGLTPWTAGYAARMRRAVRDREGDALISSPPGNRDSVSR